jgi:DNA-binding NarL/FixJ family response regulator
VSDATAGRSATLRVLIGDDHVPTRTGVRMALSRAGIDVCAEAGSAAASVEAAIRERPDVCLLDVHMPGGGTSAASTITSRLPETVVLMLTVSHDDDDLFEALRRGAFGYLVKDMDPAALPAAIRSAARGEPPLSPSMAARLVEEFRHGRETRRAFAVPGRPALTSREYDVLELLGEGASTAAIASRLFVAPVTVRRHISSILEKLGVDTREEAIRLFQRERGSE